MRSSAAYALGEIGDARSVEPLIAEIKDSDSDVREAVANALEDIGWRPDQGVNGAAYWVARQEWDRCAQIGKPAVEPLLSALTDSDSNVREAVANALEDIGWQPDQGVNGAAYWATRKEWDRCVQIGKPAIEPLIAVLWVERIPLIGSGYLVDGDSEAGIADAEALGALGI